MNVSVPYRPLPIEQQDVIYEHGPDSFPQPGVESGMTSEFVVDDSLVFPGTTRRVWVHVPRGCDPASPSNVMVFNDGWWYFDPEGEVRSGIVLDNLVHSGEIPPTVGVFVDPGTRERAGEPKQRNIEYDAFDERYAAFLIDEVLPRAASHAAISDDPIRRGICGGSSGGNAAFTAAWAKPDSFSRVVAFLSSFAQMPGGNPYPELLGSTPPRPIRVFMQAGHRDLGWNGRDMNWFAENLRTAAALAEAGYDFRLVLGDGGHSSNHGGVLLPDALRWIWRDDGKRSGV